MDNLKWLLSDRADDLAQQGGVRALLDALEDDSFDLDAYIASYGASLLLPLGSGSRTTAGAS